MELRYGRLDGATFREPGKDLGHPVLAVVRHGRAHVVRARHRVDENIGALGIVRHGLQNAHDGYRHAVHPERFSHGFRISAKSALPVVVGEHHHRVGRMPVIFGREQPSPNGSEPHDIEIGLSCHFSGSSRG